MKKEIFRVDEVMNMSQNKFNVLRTCLELGTVNLLGIHWSKYCKIYKDNELNIVIEYE